MTIQEINQKFIKELSNLYDKDEIQAIFRFYIEVKLNIVDSVLFTDNKIQYDIDNFEEDVISLSVGKPVQQVVGEAFFYDYYFRVNQHTLIPRPETEELIYLITQKFQSNKTLNIIDFCSGSGCIPITLHKLYSKSTVFGLEISEEAIKIAEHNNQRHQTQVNFIKQDILKDFTLDRKFDIITSNPPYIRELEKKEMNVNVLNFEPHLALFVEDDNPLIFYKKIAELSVKYLAENGILFCEINQYLGDKTKALFELYFDNVILHKDLSNNDRIIEASHPK